MMVRSVELKTQDKYKQNGTQGAHAHTHTHTHTHTHMHARMLPHIHTHAHTSTLAISKYTPNTFINSCI